MDPDRHRIVFLDWLRFAACFLVMLIHACECIYSNDAYPGMLTARRFRVKKLGGAEKTVQYRGAAVKISL